MKMNRAALRRLKKLLATVPLCLFDMSEWVSVTPCGTMCCAAGLAAQDPWFKKKGFHLRNSGSSVSKGLSYPVFNRMPWPWESIQVFFGLSSDDAQYIFINREEFSGKADTPRKVIARIDRVLAKSKKGAKV